MMAGKDTGRSRLQQPPRAPDVAVQPPNIGQQALEAREAGVEEVVRLLQQPEDLVRLPQLVAEVSQRHASNKAQLSATVQAQVEAARFGLELLDRSHRHIARLRMCIERIDRLCGDCATLVEHHEKIQALSYAHKNVGKVLEELTDIIDLPARAAMVEALLADPRALGRAFEGLALLAGTAANVKEAWARNVTKAQDIGELQQYLTRVGAAMADFERRLWARLRAYHSLARSDPRALVEAGRVVEIQEGVDEAAAASRHISIPPKHYRERALLEINAAAAERFAPLHQLCGAFGRPNKRVKHDQAGNRIAAEQRDYLGALISVTRVDPQGRALPPCSDAELAALAMREEEVFDVEAWVEELIRGLSEMEAELAEVYDYVAPCLPPAWRAFDNIQQTYHLQFAQALDVIGQSAEAMPTVCQLRLMEWVAAYQTTLRNLGVEEDLVHLPVAPMSDPEAKNGLGQLIQVYTDRMGTTMGAWYRNILEADTASGPRQMGDGTLRTMGATDFFRILNEQVSILEDISRGEVLFEAARRALSVMAEFTQAQHELLSRGLPLEMLCALLNNNLDCYSQSLAFTEHVQSLLEEGWGPRLEVEGVCRGFLDLAKAAAARLVDCIMSDTGMVDQLRKLYTSPVWTSGAVTGTVIATLNDYFGDVTTFVEPGFARRVAEGALEAVVGRYAAALLAAAPAPSEALLRRLEADAADLEGAFTSLIKPERARRTVSVLSDLRDLMTDSSPEGLAVAFTHLAGASGPGGWVHVTPPMVERLLAARSDLSKAQLADAAAQFREVAAHIAATHGAPAGGGAGAAALLAAGAAAGGESKGWRAIRQRWAGTGFGSG